jgi:hypothetical protein
VSEFQSFLIYYTDRIFSAVVDPTGTGAFGSGTKAEVTQQVPGVFGEISPSGQVPKRRWIKKLLIKMGLAKRAANVNKDYVRVLQVVFTRTFRKLTISPVAFLRGHSSWNNLYWYCWWSVWCLPSQTSKSQSSRTFWGCLCYANGWNGQ